MGLGLAVTALVAAVCYFTNGWYYWYSLTGGIGTIILVLAQFGVVIGLSSQITTMKGALQRIYCSLLMLH